MEQWRKRGYVPDSDDDEVELESQESIGRDAFPTVDTQLSFEAATDNGLTAHLDKIQNEKNGEIGLNCLSRVEQNHPSTPPPQSNNNNDEDDGGGDELHTQRLFQNLSGAVRNATDSTDIGGHACEASAPPSSPDELQLDKPLPPLAGTAPLVQSSADEPLSATSEVPNRQSSPVSSTLSSPPSDLESPPAESQRAENLVTDILNDPQRPQTLEGLDEAISRSLERSRRSFRQRNPIQLHPYLLEDAHYRSLLRTRGVQPVRVQQAEQHQSAADESQSKESADENVPSSDPPESFQFPPSSPANSPNRLKHVPKHLLRPLRTSPHREVSDELNSPDETNQPVSTTADRSKRRKIIRADSTGTRIQAPSRTNRSEQVQVVIRNNSQREPPQEGEIFDVPLSPPRSGGTSSTPKTVRPPKFRFPPGYSPAPVITPVTERRRSPGRLDTINIETSSEQDDGSQPGTPPERSGSGSPSEKSGASSSVELKRIQRRIKGVLPASWLRLDLRKQDDKVAERDRIASARDRRHDGKGIAQRIVRNHGQTRNGGSRAAAFFVSEESSEDDSARPINRPSMTVEEFMGFDDPTRGMNVDDDIPEDNRIDYMLPPAQRPHKRRHSGSHREEATAPAKRPKSSSNLLSKPRSRLKRQTRLTDTVSKKTPRRWKPPPLGILDAPDVTNQIRERQPQFLRVASRQARSRVDRGRKSPTRKFLRLGSRGDTEDANVSLRDWRAGTIRQSRIPENSMPGSRRPPVRENTIDNSERNDRPPTPQPNREREPSQIPSDNESIQIVGTVNGNLNPINSLPRASAASTVSGATRINRQPRTLQRPHAARGGYMLSSLRRNTPRPAQLEPVIPHARQSGRSLQFQKSLAALDSAYSIPSSRNNKNMSVPMARFLDVERPIENNSEQLSRDSQPPGTSEAQPAGQQYPRNRRVPKKRQPRRVDAEALQLRQTSSNTPHNDMIRSSLNTAREPRVTALSGLESAGRSYTVCFDIFHLPAGTFFHESTYIGSGEFSRSLKILSRNMDHGNGKSTIRCNCRTYQWGPWNDATSTELGVVFDYIKNAFESLTENVSSEMDFRAKSSEVLAIYRSIVSYLNDSLWFMDPIDRSLFVDRSITLLSTITDDLHIPNRHSAMLTVIDGFRVLLETHNLIFAHQVRQIASHGMVEEKKSKTTNNFVSRIGSRVFSIVMGDNGLAAIQRFFQENKSQSIREAGIKDKYSHVEAFIIARHILYGSDGSHTSEDDYISNAIICPLQVHKLRDVFELEKKWKSVFTIHPLYEFDELGILVPGSRFRQHFDHWKAVKYLLSVVFEVYKAEPRSQPASFVTYCRVIFHRVFYLIDALGWKPSKPTLETLFDFFARNSLYNLNKEEVRGSPRFLDELENNPTLAVESRDSCFHIFLRIIATSLRILGASRDKKEVRKFVWRLLPNHGRTYPKEEPLREEDLNALRNHHDILCVLYWASPEGCRPRIQTLRNLVDSASSHREACSIHIRSWLRLVKFQLSTDEDAANLGPFSDWHSQFINEMLNQHSLARAEVESQNAQGFQVSYRLLETTIAENQRQIESLLSSAITGLISALDMAKFAEQTRILMEKFPFDRMLSLFNPRISRLNAIVCQALDTVVSYVKSLEPNHPPAPAVDTSEDSQEFGDWTALAEMCEEHPDMSNPGIAVIENIIRPPFFRFISNCFGEEHAPDDGLLLKTIDCWLAIAHILVRNGLRQWSSYLNTYDAESWTSLRSTDQKRRFTPYFLAKFIEQEPPIYSEHRLEILNSWIASIVERGSVLKFQHQLTNVVLYKDNESPLFKNLPFLMGQNDQYDITLEQFSQRRLSLISCILSNMREHLSKAEDVNAPWAQDAMFQYRVLVKTLMGALKSNYEGLGKGNEGASGSYVEFVQRVVEFLQQHSQGICPLDPFFTDPASFPLPASDPTYIVAKLKSYGIRLSTAKSGKQLVTFTQSVSERAAIDGQQTYLVDQLYAAMSNTFECGDQQHPTIRSFLLQCVFPAYVEPSLRIPGAWIFVRPILQALTRQFSELLVDVDPGQENSVTSTVDSMAAFFGSVANALRLLVDHPGLLEEPHILFTVVSFLETVVSSLSLIDYLDRSTNSAGVLVTYIQIFKQFALFSASCLLDPAATTGSWSSFLDQLDKTNSYETSHTSPQFFQSVRRFATQELQTWLQDGCTSHNGKYFVRRGLQNKEIVVDPACTSVEGARKAFIDIVEIFFGAMEALDTFS